MYSRVQYVTTRSLDLLENVFNYHQTSHFFATRSALNSNLAITTNSSHRQPQCKNYSNSRRRSSVLPDLSTMAVLVKFRLFIDNARLVIRMYFVVNLRLWWIY
jgi:hypothetical protein